MKKTLFLLVPAAFGMLTLSACFDESSTSGSSESNKSACLLNPSETGLEITCNNESYGFLKTSSAGVYGSCGAEALRDDSGFKLVCGGDSVGVVYNGKAGRNGVNGDNGLNGQNGENGTSCEAKKVESGFELFCGEKKVGLIPNGHSCTVSTTDGASVISCEDGTEATVLNGINGKNGTNGINGTSCTTSSLKSIDIDGGVYSTITCGTTTVKIYDGAKGEQGEQGEPGENCTVSKNTTTGVTTITCGDDVATVTDGKNGAAGKNGDNCSIADNGDGTATITCGTGTSATTYTVKDGAAGENGAAGKNGDNCSIADNGDGTATITCGTGTSATEYVVNDGAKGDAGYSCSATSAVGYSIISCQTGVDADENPVYEADTILAAGYVVCGNGIYESSKGKCTGNAEDGFEWAAYTCGISTTEVTDNDFCYDGQVYAHVDYWDEDNFGLKYPATDYDSLGSGEIVLMADYCNYADNETQYPKTEYFEEAGACHEKADYWTEATTYPKNSYGQCGTGYYEKATEFCSAYNTVVKKCGEKEYDVATQYCQITGTEEDPVSTVTNIYGVCGSALYDTRTHECSENVVVAKADPIDP